MAALTAERDQLAAEKAELQDRFLRAQAEFQNSRKRAEKERVEFAEYASTEAVRALLPILDDFERATKIESSDKEYSKGHLGQVVGPEREEVGLLGDLAGPQRGPRASRSWCRSAPRAIRRPGRRAGCPWPGRPPVDAAASASAMAASTQERARAISSRDTVRGIMISTMGWPPAATRSRAASIRARTCMA